MKKVLLLFYCLFAIVNLNVAQTGNANTATNKENARVERDKRPKMTDAERADIKAAKDKIKSIKAKYKGDKQIRKNGKGHKGKHGRHHKMKHRKHHKHRGEGRREGGRRDDRPHKGESNAPKERRN
ncbi:MAG: hypothetical protein JNL70_08275 [Saprospiraceae bacterium]|nr:hypothetical protein [Saprospiraceae bacterium]